MAELSNRYYPYLNATLYHIRYSLNTGTSGAFTVKKNGIVIATITINAAEGSVDIVDTPFIANQDYLQVEITNAGSGSSDLTVQALFR